MGDVAEKRVGDRTYRVHGLQAKAEAIRGGVRRVSETAGSHLDVARAALVDWHGAHSTTFVDRVNTVMSAIVTFRLALETSASRCANFPADAVSQPSIVTQYEYSGSRLHHTDAQPSTSSAVPGNLRGYATAAAEQAGTFAGAAAPVTTDGLTAEVSQLRAASPPTSAPSSARPACRRSRSTRCGCGASSPRARWPRCSTSPTSPTRPPALRSDVDDAGAWVTAVAYAFELGDQGLLDLLLEYPEIGRFIADGVADGQGMSGEAALALILANIDRVDNAAEGGGSTATSASPTCRRPPTTSPCRRTSGRRPVPIENRLLLSMVSIVDQPVPYEIEPDDVALNAGRISMFLEFNHSLNHMALNFDEFDAAGQDPGDADDYVSEDDLRHVAGDASLPQSCATPRPSCWPTRCSPSACLPTSRPTSAA